MNAMICTQPDVLCSRSVTSIYQSDSCDDHRTTVRIFLSTLEELRICFGCGSDKQIVVMCYTDTSFVTYRNNFLSQLGLYVFNKSGAMRWKIVPCWIWMSSKVKNCDGFYKQRLSIS